MKKKYKDIINAILISQRDKLAAVQSYCVWICAGSGEANKLPQASQRQDHTNISLRAVTVIYENTIMK